MRKLFMLVAALFLLGSILVAAGCGSGGSPNHQAQEQANKNGEAFKPFVPGTPNPEQTNYNKAQELYNDPSTIIWCTAFPSSPTAPIVTVPVAGKLTSSSTTAFQPENVLNNDSSGSGVAVTQRSVDGLYHPSPPPYRYGFTPGGQYVDFFNLQTLCTTQPLKFQTQSLAISPDASLANADARAQAALKNGIGPDGQPTSKAAATAQQILQQATGGQ